ncbi:M48 family metallopeptidase [Curvibacter sp. CHRR-16]|uniref:M48 family metallopeptidase n=1 Tax=Curvibacter sp. CHRR-16 TaxID=2835872 RepID=UPI001BD99FB3|nr:M48 family metallopeptidase [Curvibacter sp. CHRR-16]MBT0570287.1 M48 family metallopeptidase [Curvibacter sp. CHRR-16]
MDSHPSDATAPRITGRLFAPGLDGVGVPATAYWWGGQLHVQANGKASGQTDAQGQTWVVQEPARVSAGGFNAAELSIAWQDGGGDPSTPARLQFFVDAGASRSALAAGMPAHWAGDHATAQRQARGVQRRFRMAWWVMGLASLLPLVLVLALLLNAGNLLNWAIKHIPPEHEAKLGDIVLAQTKAQMRVIDSGAAVDAVKSIGAKLTTGSAYTYRWLVVDEPSINAFAAPGGVVVVHSGLLKAAATAEEAAGVLAHEVAHAELRHGLQGMVKGLGLKAIASVVLGDWSGLAGDAATQLLHMQFSRQAEEEADAEGLRRLVAARIDPQGMARFMDTLAKQQGVALPALLSTHPDSAERAQRLRTLAAQHPGPWEPLAVDWKAVQDSVR